jgi:signal transduction histidine kinase
MLFIEIQKDGRSMETESFRKLDEATSANTFLELILNLAPNPMFITDRHSTRVLFVNAAAERVLGSSFKNRVIGDDFHETTRPLAISGQCIEEESIHPAEQVRLNGFLDPVETTWMTMQGVRTFVVSSACLLKPIRGQYLCVYSMNDITDIKESEKALKDILESQELVIGELREKSEELNRIVEAKQRLLSQLSHEVKNPLGIIMGFSSLVKESDEYAKNPEIQQSVDAISRNAEHILTVVNDQLVQSKTEFARSQIQVQIENIDLDQLSHRLRISIGMLASKKGIQFSIENRLPGMKIQSDMKLLRQVLMNLIGNALKFTEQGEVKVSIFKNENSMLCFEVKDSGVGIDPKDQAKLFEPFFQAHKDAEVRSLGSGLGLNIVKGIANQLGGSIRLLESQLNVGSTFNFEIPLNRAD